METETEYAIHTCLDHATSGSFIRAIDDTIKSFYNISMEQGPTATRVDFRADVCHGHTT